MISYRSREHGSFPIAWASGRNWKTVQQPPTTPTSEAAAELVSVRARQQEIREKIATESATIAAIKASGVYQLGQFLRKFFPGAAPPAVAEVARRPAVSLSDATGPRFEELERERAELARLEDEWRRMHVEFHRLSLSRPRRIWMALRHLLLLLRHPVWTLGAAWRVAGNTGPVRSVRMAWRRFRIFESRLRFEPPGEQKSDRPHPGDAIRWLAPVRISGVTEHALLMHPSSAISYRMAPPRGARVVAECALLPTVWAENHGGVVFEVSVSSPDGPVRASASVHVNPGDRFADRRWRRLVVEVPPDLSGDVIMHLATRLPAGVSPAGAHAVWGEPHLEWARSGAEMWKSIVILARRIRKSGVGATLRHIRGVQASDQHAELYRQWMAVNTPRPETLAHLASEVDALTYRPRISVLTPVYNTDPAWLRACIESVVHQIYPHWELCIADDGSTNTGTLAVLKEYEAHPRIRMSRLAGNSGISLASNAALESATGEFVVTLDHDDELAPEALYEVVRTLNRAPDLDFIYSDEDKLGATGERCDPYFKPDWSPEHFRSCMYTCHLLVLRTSLVRELGGFRKGFEGSQDYDLVLRVVERTERIHHVPQILYHWRKSEGSTASSGLAKTWVIDAGERALQEHVERSGMDAAVVRGPGPGLFRIRHRIAGKPLVSIILPTAGRSRFLGDRTIDLLSNCVGSVANKSTYENYELIIGDDGALPEETVAFLESMTVPIKRVSFPQPEGFNYGRKLNFIASHSKAPHLILFNDDIEVIAPGWIEAMLEFSQQEAIGAVGGKLLFGDGRIQHIGMVVGVNGMCGHVFHGHQGSTPGYGASAQIIRNYSAVTAACMMTRREIYERLGGFQTRFQFDFNDVDYCLRVRRLGHRVVFTPYAELFHLEWATWGTRPWHAEEVDYMQRTWADACAHDPYYNPNLSRDHVDYRPRV